MIDIPRRLSGCRKQFDGPQFSLSVRQNSPKHLKLLKRNLSHVAEMAETLNLNRA